MAAGYSGTPLSKKLGVKESQPTWRHQMPASVAAEIERSGLNPLLLSKPAVGRRMAHIFVTRRDDLAKQLVRLRHLPEPSGAIWVSWPKRSAKVPTDITEDTIRAQALPLQLVDAKVLKLLALPVSFNQLIRRRVMLQLTATL